METWVKGTWAVARVSAASEHDAGAGDRFFVQSHRTSHCGSTTIAGADE